MKIIKKMDLILWGGIIGLIGAGMVIFGELKERRSGVTQMSSIESTTKSALNNLTGANSVCFIDIINVAQDHAEVWLMTEGPEPVEVLNVMVYDLKKGEASKSGQDLLKGYTVFGEKKMPVKSASPIGIIQANFSGDKANFNIFLTTPTRRFVQALKMTKVKNEWKSMVQVSDQNTGKTLYTEIQPGYPSK